jgi:hypothetical protein
VPRNALPRTRRTLRSSDSQVTFKKFAPPASAGGANFLNVTWESGLRSVRLVRGRAFRGTRPDRSIGAEDVGSDQPPSAVVFQQHHERSTSGFLSTSPGEMISPKGIRQFAVDPEVFHSCLNPP